MPDDTDPSHRLELVTDLAEIDADIARWGCSFLTVEERGRGRPAFAATLGLAHTYGHPELVVVGANRELHVAILTGLSDMVRVDDVRLSHWSRPRLEAIPFQLLDVHPTHFETLMEFWPAFASERGLRTADPAALQAVIPDRYFCAHHAKRKYWLDDPRPLVERPRSAGHRQRRPKRRAS